LSKNYNYFPDTSGMSITPRIIGGAITPMNSESLAMPIRVNDSGSLVVVGGETSNTLIGDGSASIASAGTSQALPSISCNEVTIEAKETNTGVITIGSSTVVAAIANRRGIALWPSDSVTFEIDNLSKLYIDSTVTGDSITYAYVR